MRWTLVAERLDLAGSGQYDAGPAGVVRWARRVFDVASDEPSATAKEAETAGDDVTRIPHRGDPHDDDPGRRVVGVVAAQRFGNAGSPAAAGAGAVFLVSVAYKSGR